MRLDADSRPSALKCVFMRTLPERLAHTFLDNATLNRRNAQDVLFRQGDPATSVYIVLEGLLKLSRITNSGAEAVVHIAKPGDSLAEALAFEEGTYPVNCTVLQDASFVTISTRLIRETVLAEPKVFASVLRSTFAHLHQLVDQIEELKVNTTVIRVARFLLGQCETNTGTYSFRLPYEKAVIAGVLGMTPETLSRSFAKLRDRGVRIEGDQVFIQDVSNLARFLDGA